MLAKFSARASNLISGKVSDSLPRYCLSSLCDGPTSSLFTRFRFFSSVSSRGDPMAASDQSFDNINTKDGYCDIYEEDGRMSRGGHHNPPHPIPNRPLRAHKPIYQTQHPSHTKLGNNYAHDDGGGVRFDESIHSNKPSRIGGNSQSPSSDFDKSSGQGDGGGHDFLKKFRLVSGKGENAPPKPTVTQLHMEQVEEGAKNDKAGADPAAAPQDADDIFKKMKETGLIPNAVAMLDGLCKDGLVQEAMKLFGLMREKGTIPEVVIYTAVVEGFCKAHKFDDATRIFRKMQKNGVSPNAFSYTVLIQGHYKGNRLEDALDFCVEMLEAGHSPNVATFVGLIDGFCRQKGVEQAQRVSDTLKHKGFFLDDKAVKDYLEKKGPFFHLVWESIFGKKSSQRFL